MSVSDDRLLYVLSARREMPWAAYKVAFDALHTPTDGGLNEDALARRRLQTARTLDALGHCDMSFDEWGGRVAVAPATLARLPQAGLPKAVLTGARAPDTITQLAAACASRPRPTSLSITPGGGKAPLIPAHVVVEADDTGDLAEIACALDIAFAEQPPAWALAHFSGSLNAKGPSENNLDRTDAAGVDWGP